MLSSLVPNVCFNNYQCCVVLNVCFNNYQCCLVHTVCFKNCQCCLVPTVIIIRDFISHTISMFALIIIHIVCFNISTTQISHTISPTIRENVIHTICLYIETHTYFQYHKSHSYLLPISQISFHFQSFKKTINGSF